MAAKRSRKVSKKVSEAYEQAMVAEGAPVALDLLGFGSTIGDILRGRKSPAKSRAKKKTKTKPRSKTVRTKKKAAAKSPRKNKK